MRPGYPGGLKTGLPEKRAAADFLPDGEEAAAAFVCVFCGARYRSGGQGAGENISEAAAIRDGLIAQGVDPSRIYLEADSSDTEENIAFSKAVMEENNLPGEVLPEDAMLLVPLC